MRILIIGLIVFVGWSALSTYIYVCKIKGLCIQPQTTLVEAVDPNSILITESKMEEKTIIPKDMVIYFAFDKSDFNVGEEFRIYFENSNAYLQKHTQAKLNITGHTDAVGTIEYNQALGLRRANALRTHFENMGMPASWIEIDSKGKKEPAADNSSDQGRAKNRRTVVTIKK